MRGKDIKVGAEYRVGYGARGKVLAKELETSSWSGTVRRDGVQLLILEPAHRAGEEVVYTSREVQEPWEDYAERKQAIELQKKMRSEVISERESKTQEYKTRLQSLGVKLKDAGFARWGNADTDNFDITLTLDSTEVERLVGLLATPEMLQRAAEMPETKEQDASALARLFGS